MKKYGFLILHYGDIDITMHCIDSIIQLKNSAEYIVVIVDNDTNKTNYEMLIEKYNDTNCVKVIRTGGGLGFSEANNYGYRYVLDKFNPEYLIVANNDIVFEQQDLPKLIESSYIEDRWDILSPDVIGADDGQHQSPIALRARKYSELRYTIFFNTICLVFLPIVFPVLNRKMKTYGYREYIAKKTSNVVPCGACIVLSKHFLESEDKLFVPETKFYYEEYILHHRCKIKGYSIIYNPMIRVIHGDGKATKNKSVDEKKRLRFLMKNTLDSAKIYRDFMKKYRSN